MSGPKKTSEVSVPGDEKGSGKQPARASTVEGRRDAVTGEQFQAFIESTNSRFQRLFAALERGAAPTAAATSPATAQRIGATVTGGLPPSGQPLSEDVSPPADYESEEEDDDQPVQYPPQGVYCDYIDPGFERVRPSRTASSEPRIYPFSDETLLLLESKGHTAALDEYRVAVCHGFFSSIADAALARVVQAVRQGRPAEEYSATLEQVFNSRQQIGAMDRRRLAFLRFSKMHEDEDSRLFTAFSRKQYFTPGLAELGSSELADSYSHFREEVHKHSLIQAAKSAAFKGTSKAKTAPGADTSKGGKGKGKGGKAKEGDKATGIPEKGAKKDNTPSASKSDSKSD